MIPDANGLDIFFEFVSAKLLKKPIIAKINYTD